ncbi:MAG: DNA translocase FtsK [Acidobacteriota bacterium]
MTIKSQKKSLVNDVVAVLLIAVAALLLLALFTYDPKDPSWNSVSSKTEPSNLIGVVGAYVSDLFLQLFGLASFIIPPLIVYIAVKVFYSRGARIPALKFAGSTLLLVAFSGFLSLFPKIGISALEHISGNGGAVGYVLSEKLVSLLNTMGAAIVLAAVSVLTLILTMDISLSSIMGWVRRGKKVEKGKPSVFERFRAWLGNRIEQHHIRAEEKRALRIEQDRQRRAEEDRLRREREERMIAQIDNRRSSTKTKTQEIAPEPPPEPVIATHLIVEEVSIVAKAAEDNAIAEATGEKAATQNALPEPVVSAPIASEPVVSAPVASAPVASVSSAPAVSKTRQKMASVLRARAARAETTSDDVTMDPDVAEMTSTAWIDRSVPSPDVAEETAKEKTRSRKPIIAAPQILYKLPSLDLLEAPIGHHEQAEEELRARATLLAEKCKEFGVIGHIHRINPGPVVTTFEFKPDPGIKYSRVVGLTDDLCLGLQAESIRIDRIPGKSTVGMEVPNLRREKICLREVIDSPRFQHSESKLTVALGKTINGEEYITDLTKMPHLLIAGATGAGKSVTLNAIVCSIIYKATPDEVKFIMVDPKRVELGLYENIPHLLTPIVTDPKRAANALKWAVNEMEERYRSLASMGVRNIDQYNRQVREMTHPTISADDPDAPRPLPYIVIAIDELADLMMVARGEVETSIARLAQMARAVGIHLVLATQRPSVDIITGVIKANIPSRIAFRVSQKVDSRTIIDSNGAESLLGQGDMLFLPPGSARLIRVHGSFVNEDEVKKIADHTRKQAEPQYNEQVTLSEQEAEESAEIGERDELYEEALEIVISMGRASTSVLQRRLSVGYGRAAKILDMMEREGFIGPAEGSKPRKVLSAAYEFRERISQRLEEADE